MRFKDVLDKLIKFGDDHSQIQNTNWGKIEELTQQSGYSLMWIYPTQSRFEDDSVVYTFQVWFVDKLIHDNSNRKDVFDAMILIGSDLVSKFHINMFHTNGFYIQNPVIYDFDDGLYNDYLGGIFLTIDCISNNLVNCQIP